MTLEDLNALAGARPNGCNCADCAAVREAWPEVLRLARERLEQAERIERLEAALRRLVAETEASPLGLGRAALRAEVGSTNVAALSDAWVAACAALKGGQ